MDSLSYLREQIKYAVNTYGMVDDKFRLYFIEFIIVHLPQQLEGLLDVSFKVIFKMGLYAVNENYY